MFLRLCAFSCCVFFASGLSQMLPFTCASAACSLVLSVGLTHVSHLHWLQGPLVWGPARVCLFCRTIHARLPRCLPRVVLVPLAVLVDVPAHSRVHLPIGLMRTAGGTFLLRAHRCYSSDAFRVQSSSCPFRGS